MRIILSLILLITTQSCFAQMKLNGVTLPAKITVGKTELVLNGGGIRTKMFFKIYVAGLYLESKSKDAKTIVSADKPTGIKIQITSGMVNSEKMEEAIREGFTKSTGGNTASLKPKIDVFVSMFTKEPIKVGDIFQIIYVPGTGTVSTKNGKAQGTIKGLDFKKALFGIWLSPTPVDEDLKKGLLGN